MSSGNITSHRVAGRYQLLAKLGQGGMAEVFLAVSRGPSGFHKLLVIKQLSERLSDDPEMVAMFRDEAALAARMNHPNIVQTNEVGEEDGRFFIVMEYLEGQPLENILRLPPEERPPLAMRLRILCDVLTALDYAHHLAGFDGAPLCVVHRDVTPHNIFATYDGQIRLVDFGIAQAKGRSRVTEAGVLKGKVCYMSPEQASGEPIDATTDLFAAGTILFEMVTDRRMWHQGRDAEILVKLAMGNVPKAPDVKPDVPKWLADIVAKATAVDQSARYRSAREFLTELERGMEEHGLRASTRDVAVWVSERFAADRARIRAVIEAELGKLGDSSREADAGSLPTLPSAARSDPGKSKGAEITLQPTNRPSSSSSRGKSRRLFLAALVASVLLAVIVAYGALRRGHAPEPASAAPSAPAPSATVRIDVRADPHEAALFLDGQKLPDNPASSAFPRDGSRHVLRAEAPGYEARSEDVVFDDDAKILLALTPLPQTPSAQPQPASKPPATASPKPAKQTKAAPVAPSASGPTATPNCNPPYWIDSRGIRRPKPECL